MTPAQRVYAVLRGEIPDQVPFTVYEYLMDGFPFEQSLREQGACVVHRVSSARITYPNVQEFSETVYVDGRKHIRTVRRTPYGDLTTLTEPAGLTSWTREHMFKTPDDYKKMAFLFSDMQVTSRYEELAEQVALDRAEQDVIFRDDIGLEPLQKIIDCMGTLEFCYEWMDNRDEILKLYSILRDKARLVYPIIAASPFRFSNYGGNVTPEIIGRDVFAEYYMPVYEEAAEVFRKYAALSKSEKKLGVHFDADNTTIMDLIGQTPLDYIEAYDISMSPDVATAMGQWPDKILWLNWPSGWQCHSREGIIQDTKDIPDQAKDRSRFIIGITEDIPADIHERNLRAILQSIQQYGQNER